LDTLDSPAEIDPSMCQSVLNVNYQPGGNAIFKRDGYGLFQTLPISCSTCAVHGGYHFQQLGGNDVQLWGNDGELAASVNDATFVKVATGTIGATWQCTDSQGKAYCFTSQGDTPVITDGTAANTSFSSTIPAGTMGTFTPLQLVVAGVSGNTNTINISAQLAFTNFTAGILPSSAFTEPIASPGSRITHLAYYFGRLFWWKDQSFGYATFTSQFDWQLTIVSNQIGTLDNSDAFWNSSGFDAGTMFSGTQQANANSSPGGIFFRGQDNHVYVYDGYYLTRLSRIITPSITASNRKKADSWTQTTQADFQQGSIIPSQNLSTTISPGDVISSSFSTVENSSTQWVNGYNNGLTINPSSITLPTNNLGNITNPDFESSFSGNWTNSGTTNWTQTASVSDPGGCGTISPEHGSFFATSGQKGGEFDALNLSGVMISSVSFAGGNCSWTQYFLSPGTFLGQRVKFRFISPGSSGANATMTTSDSYIWGGQISFWGLVGLFSRNVDNVQLGSSTISMGSFTSQIYNTGFTSTTYTLQSNFTATLSAPSFGLWTSASSAGPFSELLTSTGTNAIGNQYALYTATVPVGDALTSINSVSIISQSTGTFYSAVKNAPAITSWGEFTADQNIPGISSITYYVRTATASFTVLSSTPLWLVQPLNAQVVYSTGTYLQARADFYLSAATETPTLNDFTFNWFEGTAGDKAYIAYFNDAIWFSVSSSTSVTTNNTIFYWDLLNGAWTVYNIPANGFQIENNALYFGDPIKGSIYKFGGVTTDNGAAINSYWKSKDFLGNQNPYSSANGQQVQFAATDDLFTQKEFTQADFILGESSTTLSYVYTLDSSTSTTFTMNAYSPTASLIQRNFLLPIGKIGKYYNFQIGDNSSAPKWTFMGHRVIYNPLNWRPVLSN
jgi:hypothetical protein